MEELVALAFPNDPIMAKIVKCESNFKHYAKNGKVIISKTNDYGLFQINGIHLKEAKKRGIDITTPEGNTAFAKILFKQSKYKPWVCRNLI